MLFLASNITKEKYSCFRVTEILNKTRKLILSSKVTFLSILLSSFDLHEKNFCGRICYKIIKFFTQFHQNLLKEFEFIAYMSIWAFSGCSQSCLFFEQVLEDIP